MQFKYEYPSTLPINTSLFPIAVNDCPIIIFVNIVFKIFNCPNTKPPVTGDGFAFIVIFELSRGFKINSTVKPFNGTYDAIDTANAVLISANKVLILV